MGIFKSLFFLISFLSLFLGMFFFKKSDKKTNAVIWIIPTIFISLFYLVFFAGIVNLFTVKINLISCSLICLLSSFPFWYKIIKTREKQKYFFDSFDFFSFLAISILGAFFIINQFTLSFFPIYETSDPGVHLKMAMDIINTGKLGSMFFAPLINSIFIKTFGAFFSLIKYSRLFVVSDALFFLVSGYAFYGYAAADVKNKFKKLLILFITAFYMIGYPLNNMVFGFNYLGISITVISVILFMLRNFDGNYPKLFVWISFMASMLSVSMCYILFAPTVYIVVFIEIAKKYKNSLVSVKHIFTQLKIFLIPSLMSIYYFAVVPENFSMSGLSIEGYIYNDFISNFIFLILPVLMYIVSCKTEKQFTPTLLLLILLLVQLTAFFILGIKGTVSSYYYFKFYYPLSFVCFTMFADWISKSDFKTAKASVCYLTTIALLFAVSETRIESKIINKNLYFCHRTAVYDLFDIYHFNYQKICCDEQQLRNSEWVQRYQLYNYVIENCNANNDIYLADTFSNVYWYEAISNQRFTAYSFGDKNAFIDNYRKNNYVIIIPESDEYKNNTDIFGNDFQIVFENELGFIAKVN